MRFARWSSSAALVAVLATAGCAASTGPTGVGAQQGVEIVVAPSSARLLPGGTVDFTATVTGTSATEVSWSVDQNDGAIDASGHYTAPQSPGVYTVTATTSGSPALTKTAQVLVTASLGPLAPLGVNVYAVVDWVPMEFFADLVRQGRNWASISDTNTPAPVDANGWPTGDAQIVVGSAPGLLARAEAYKLSYTGNATLQLLGGTVSNKAYDAGSNTTTADVVISANSNVVLKFTGQAGGVKNVKLMRPGHGATDVFSKTLLTRASQFQALRFMQSMGIPGYGVNGNTSVNWSDRSLPGQLQTGQAGISLEYVAMLSNLAGTDAWINLPLNATDDYVTKVAQLFKYGSDGVNPYTSPQASPAYPPLSPDRKLYVEWVNELWNGGYATSGQNQSAAQSEYSNGDPYHYGSSTSFDLGQKRLARRLAQISLIFRSVFGDDSMMTQVRPVLAAQLVNSGTISVPTAYLNSVWGPSNTYGNPQHPVSYYVYGIAGANYLPDVSNPASTDAVFANWAGSGGTTLYNGAAAFKGVADTYGVKFLLYEGGQHLLPATGGGTIKTAAQLDPRMKDAIVTNYHTVWAKGADLAMYYCLATAWDSYGYWGLSDDLQDDSGPKWDAARQLLAGQ
jgi:hypothetical protein